MTDLENEWAGYSYGADQRSDEKTKRLRFAFYGRCSTDDNQDPETSKAWQMRVASALVANSGGSIVLEFFDIGFSRSLPWSRRPEAAAILNELDRPGRRFDAVVVGEGQRCFYGTQFADLAPRFDHYGVQLWLPELSGPYDSDNTTQDMLMAITGGMSKGERKRIQERVKQGMAAQVETEGRWQGGRAPYGYLAVPWKKHPNPKKASEGFMQKRLELDPVAAPVVQRIFQDAVDGLAVRAIARTLNEEGVPCPSAHDPGRNSHRKQNGWQPATVSSLLANPRYTGYEFWGKFKKQEELVSAVDTHMGYQTRLVRSKDDLIRSKTKTHPSIVDVDIFLSVQKIIAGRSTRIKGGPRVKSAYIFQSMIHCDVCARKLEINKTAKGKVTYRCRGGRDIDKTTGVAPHPRVVVDESVLAPLVSNWIRYVFHPDRNRDTLDSLNTAHEDSESPIEAVQQQRVMTRQKELEEENDRLVDLIIRGVVPEAAGASKLNKISKELEAAKGEAEGYAEMERMRSLASGDNTASEVLRDMAETDGDAFNDAMDEALSAESDPAKVNEFYRALGLTMIFLHATNEVRLELQPKLDSQANLVPVLGDKCVRGGTHASPKKSGVYTVIPLIHAKLLE
jgi:site-specific DNA recombinase